MKINKMKALEPIKGKEVDVPQLNLLLERASKDVKSINELKNIAVKLQLYELGAKCREIEKELTLNENKRKDMKNQSKRSSLLESIVQTVVGLVISFGIQVVIYPMLGIPVTLNQNIIITFVFFVASIGRGYVIRRIFNKGKI